MPTRPAHRQQIVADIIEKINNGTYPPGAELPSIAELAELYACSTTPVKYALNELSIRGYVVTHAGKKARVAERPPANPPNGGT